MPKLLASGNTTVFHWEANVTPPKSLDEWGTLVRTLVQHLVDRYGLNEVQKWYFECWNEPNLDGFWAGN
jgi:xylan 1,4-beta-xylosidase